MKFATAANSCKKLTEMWGWRSPQTPDDAGKSACSVVLQRLSPKKIIEVSNSKKTLGKQVRTPMKAKAKNPILKSFLNKKQIRKMEDDDLVIVEEKINRKSDVDSKENAGASLKTHVSSPKNACLKELNQVGTILNQKRNFRQEITDNNDASDYKESLCSINSKNCLSPDLDEKKLVRVPEYPFADVVVDPALLKKIPKATVIECSIPQEVFGDALMVYVFLDTFNELLNVRRYFSRKTTLQTVQKILFDKSLEGPLCALLEMWLQAYYSYRKIKNGGQILPNAGGAIQWDEVRTIPFDPYIISEMVRAHIIVASRKLVHANDKLFREAARLLEERSVFELKPRERVVVLNVVMETLLQLPDFGELAKDIHVTVLRSGRELSIIRKCNIMKEAESLERLVKLKVARDLFPHTMKSSLTVEPSIVPQNEDEPHVSPQDKDMRREDPIPKETVPSADSSTYVDETMLKEAIKERGITNVLKTCEKKLEDTLNKLQNHVFLGHDCDYRGYWAFKSIPCILVEENAMAQTNLSTNVTKSGKPAECDKKEDLKVVSQDSEVSQTNTKQDFCNKWSFFSEKDDLAKLTDSLNRELFPEYLLKEKLTSEKNFLKHLLPDSKDETLWTKIFEEKITRFRKSSSVSLENVPELLEKAMIASLLDFEEKLRVGAFGGITSDLEEWYTALENRDYEKFIEDRETIDSSLPDGVAAYICALLQIKRSIRRKVYHKYFHFKYDSGWTEYVRKAKNLSQLFLGLCLLERSIRWDASLLGAKCRVCKRSAAEGMLLCDKCDDGYHMKCLDPPLQKVPEGNWYCAVCEWKRQPKVEEETGGICKECGKENLTITCRSCYGPIRLECLSCCDQLSVRVMCLLCGNKNPVPDPSKISSQRLTRAKRETLVRAAKNPYLSSKKRRSGRGNRCSPKKQHNSELPMAVRCSQRIATKRRRTWEKSITEEEEEDIEEVTPKRGRSSRAIRGSQEIEKLLRDEVANDDSAGSGLLDIKACEEIVAKLQNHEDSAMFLNYVRKDTENPMDLMTVRSNLRSMTYSSNDELVRDIRTIFDNYRKSTRKPSRAASRLEIFFDTLLSQYEPFQVVHTE